MLTVLPPNFVSLCTSSRYGGKLEVSDNNRTEFTSTGIKLLKLLMKELAQFWNSVGRISPQLPLNFTAENKTQFAAFVESSDLVIVCSFVMQLPKLILFIRCCLSTSNIKTSFLITKI